MLDLWKLLVAIFVLTLASSQAAASHQETEDELSLTSNEDRARKSKLELLIESFKDVIRNGNDSMGIPVMDPYVADKIIIELDEDCLKTDSKFTNVRMEGLADYTVDKATFSLFKMKVTVVLTWPTLSFFTKYNVKANLGFVPIYGSGIVKSIAKNVKFSSVTTVGVNSHMSVYVRSFTSKMTLGALDFTITGLYNSEMTSTLASTIVSENAPQFVESYQKILTDKLNVMVVDQLNPILGNMTLSELINLIV